MHQPVCMEQLLDMVRRYVAANHPRRAPVRLRIDRDNGERIQLPIPDARLSGTPDRAPDLREIIHRTLGESDLPLKSSALAARAGYSFSGHFRHTIRQMRVAGAITGRDDGAYALPPEEESWTRARHFWRCCRPCVYGTPGRFVGIGHGHSG